MTNAFDDLPMSGPIPDDEWAGLLPALETIEPEPVPATAESPAVDFGDYSVELAGRRFIIQEPDIDDITALCRWIGDKGTRAGQIVGQQLKGLFMEVVGGKPMAAIPYEQIVFGLLAGLYTEDIIKLGVILLFGGADDAKKDGIAWFKGIDRRHIKIEPLVQAFAYRVALSQDLRAALKRLPLVQAAFQV